MIVLNFSHKMTPGQLEQLATLTGNAVEQVVDLLAT